MNSPAANWRSIGKYMLTTPPEDPAVHITWVVPEITNSQEKHETRTDQPLLDKA